MNKLHHLWKTYRAQWLFLLTLGAVYGVWYLLYEGWLGPAGRVDAWLAEHLAAHGGWLLHGAGLDPVVSTRALAVPGARGVLVSDACNGLATLGLFVGFVAAFPGRMTRRLLFIPLGLLLLYAANAVRVAVLAGLQAHWPLGFEVLHGGGTMFFYTIIFLLWVVWVRFGDAELRSDSHPDAGSPQPATA